jgi:hypothetical protein
MPWVGFEPPIPAVERAKAVHALDREPTVTGFRLFYLTLVIGSRVLLAKLIIAQLVKKLTHCAHETSPFQVRGTVKRVITCCCLGEVSWTHCPTSSLEVHFLPLTSGSRNLHGRMLHVTWWATINAYEQSPALTSEPVYRAVLPDRADMNRTWERNGVRAHFLPCNSESFVFPSPVSDIKIRIVYTILKFCLLLCMSVKGSVLHWRNNICCRRLGYLGAR